MKLLHTVRHATWFSSRNMCYEGRSYSRTLHILRIVEVILNDQLQYRRLLMQRGALAQSLLDLLQTLCDTPDLKSDLRSKMFTAMARLSKKSGLYPNCLTLNNIEMIGDHPVTAGGFAEIWKGCVDGQLACVKVVKVYGDSDVQRLLRDFLQEAVLWRQLDHPNVLPFLGLFYLDQNKHRVCLLSPWMDYGNLRQFLTDVPEPIDRNALAFDITSGLAYLHCMKIIHGDLKGANILINSSRRAIIADFGLSRMIMESEVLSLSSTSSHLVQGTARWLAPECLIKMQRASYGSDIYSFGSVCYEVFTGHQPFYQCLHDAAVVFELMKGNRPVPPTHCPHLTDKIWATMQECWREEPSERPSASVLLSHFSPMEKSSEYGHPTDNWPCPYLWKNVQYPELCPAGSELETFLFKSGDIPDLNLADSRSFLFRALSLLLFTYPNTYYLRLEKLWIHGMFMRDPWNQLIGQFMSDWVKHSIIGIVVLMTNIASLSLRSAYDGRNSFIYRAGSAQIQIASYTSIICSLGAIQLKLLLWYFSGFTHHPTPNGFSWLYFLLNNLQHSTHGLEVVSIVYSLPRALLLWALSCSLICFLYEFCFTSSGIASLLFVFSVLLEIAVHSIGYLFLVVVFFALLLVY